MGGSAPACGGVFGTQYKDTRTMNEAEGTENGQVMTSGISLIHHERERQITVEGYSLDRDWFNYPSRQLEAAAHCYVRAATYEEEMGVPWPQEQPPRGWPWPVEGWKPSGGVIRCMEKAGALFLAQADIDRESKSTEEHAQMIAAALAMGADIDRVRIGQPRCITRMMNDLAEEFREAAMMRYDTENISDVKFAEAVVFETASARILEAWRGYQARVRDWQERQKAGPGDRTA